MRAYYLHWGSVLPGHEVSHPRGKCMFLLHLFRLVSRYECVGRYVWALGVCPKSRIVKLMYLMYTEHTPHHYNRCAGIHYCFIDNMITGII